MHTKTLAEKTADKIRDLIHRNELQSGTKLNEVRLCEQLGVSRTPLREALHALSAEGLVELLPNRGAHVAELSIEELRHAFEVMSVLEGSCARMATERLTHADLKELEEIHGQLEEYFQNNDPHGYVKHNQHFHQLLQEKAGNPLLGKMVSDLRARVLPQRFRQIYRPGRLESSMDEHRWLIEAIRARDGEKAEKMMRIHLQRQCDALVMYYAELGRETSTKSASHRESPKRKKKNAE